jgi:hypothetical protein
MSDAAGMMLLMMAIDSWNVGVLVTWGLWDRLETQMGPLDIVTLIHIYILAVPDRKIRKARLHLARARKTRCVLEI